MNKLIKLIKSEFEGFGKYETIIFPLLILVICILSFIAKDNKIALISAICGIGYTVLAGKGKVLCYFIGITGTICYSYFAYINGFYGNLALYALYYIPMELIGIFEWNKHLKKNERTIEKTALTLVERVIYIIVSVVLSLILLIFLMKLQDKNPVIDSITTVLSVIGQILTVKRCIEQWYVWFIVNLLSVIMWINAYINGAECLATVIMWFVYLLLSIYFLNEWKKELNKK